MRIWKLLKAVAASIFAAAGCVLLYRALLRVLSYSFQAAPVPKGSVFLYLVGFVAAIVIARWLWSRWRLVFGGTAFVVSSYSFVFLQSLRDQARLLPHFDDRWLHGGMTSRTILGVLFLVIGGVTYYYELLGRR